MKKKTKIIAIVISFLLIGVTTINAVYSCTGIRLIAKNGQVVFGRTMEWGAFDLDSRVSLIPRGFEFKGITPDGENGKTWKAKYGAVGLDMLGQPWLADGMNEKGLVIGMFYHPGFGQCPPYVKGEADNTITAKQVTNYIITQYSTLDEVREGMKIVRVVPVLEQAIGVIIEAHWMVTNAKGKSIVIEYENGELKIYDNPLGVITNAPYFPWHETNIRNYVGMSPLNHPDVMLDSVDFSPLGIGNGMMGLPGDNTPPSRFVRAVAWTQTARPLPNSEEAIYELFRILDNFNLPLLPKPADSKPAKPDGMRSSTIWTSGYDVSNLGFYYHTQNNRRLRYLDVKAIDFGNIGNEVITLKQDAEKKQDLQDITPKL